MALRIGITADADLAPLFFPVLAGWAPLGQGTTTQTAPLADLEQDLLKGRLDIAPVSPLLYAANTATLSVLPTPVRAFELASDSIFLISHKRLDQLERSRVAISPNSHTGEAILKLIAGKYYGIIPECYQAESEAAALESLLGQREICVVSGEAAMRAVGWAKAKGFFVEDLTKAWWIMTGLPLPVYLLGVRREWADTEPEAAAQARALMLALRRGLQIGQEQRPTLLERVSLQTGLPQEALENHFRNQRYELNEGHLRGLLEFYRRAATQNLAPLVSDLQFFPSLAPVSPAPAGPPRRSQPEKPRPVASPNRDRLKPVPPEPAGDEGSNSAPSGKSSRGGSRRSEAEARGLRVIKGGKNEAEAGISEEDED